jgi:uncharacterized protein (DUF4415 family)
MANILNPYLIDDENPEWTDEMLALAIARKVNEKKAKQAAPLKQIVTLRLDVDIVEKFKATGAGWHNRVNNALKSVEVMI